MADVHHCAWPGPVLPQAARRAVPHLHGVVGSHLPFYVFCRDLGERREKFRITVKLLWLLWNKKHHCTVQGQHYWFETSSCGVSWCFCNIQTCSGVLSPATAPPKRTKTCKIHCKPSSDCKRTKKRPSESPWRLHWHSQRGFPHPEHPTPPVTAANDIYNVNPTFVDALSKLSSDFFLRTFHPASTSRN